MSESDLNEQIILDACCLINLFASGFVRDILDDLPAQFVVARYVCDHEALYVLTDSASSERQRIDVASLVSEDLIQVGDLVTEQETASFVDLTARIEDGEAATCALAIHRNYTVATDERKVLNLIRGRLPLLRVRTTAELVKWWADTTLAPEAQVRAILRNIRSRGRFGPSKLDPLYHWWNNLAGET